MQIGIVGNGMVGSAMNYLFPEAKVYDISPSKSKNTKEEINQCDIVFICVPTDGSEQGYNLEPIHNTLEWLTNPIIVLKSTVSPGTTTTLSDKYNKNIIFNPEFLRENSRFKDIENEHRIIIGTNSRNNYKKLKQIYETKYRYKNINYIHTTPIMAETIKLVNNSYLASKVTFCNEVKQITDRLDLNYEEFRNIWLLDQRIGESHTQVTEQGGYGGYCLPKDLKALIHTAELLNYNPEFLKQTWNSNCKFRKEFKGEEYS